MQDTSLLISTASINASSTIPFFLHAAVKLALSCRRSKHECEVAVLKPLLQYQNFFVEKKMLPQPADIQWTASVPQGQMKETSADAGSTDGKSHMFPIQFQLDLFEILYSKRLNTPALICYV
jgi:hypothetical protein